MIQIMSALFRSYRKGNITLLTQKRLGVAIGACRKTIRYVALISFLALSMSTCTRPIPPAGKNAPVIRGQQQDVYFYPARSGMRDAPKVLFLCGDGGWQGRAIEVAVGMSKAGYDVYGLDTKRYLESFTTTAGALTEEDVQRDMAQIAKWMQTRWRERISILGWSEGAGLAVLAAASRDNEAVFNGVVTLGLSNTAFLGWRLRDDVTYITHGDPDEPMFRTRDYIPKVAPLALCMIQSSGDQFVSKDEAEALFGEAQQPKLYKLVQAQDHGFNGNTEGFFQALSEGLAWVDQTPR